MKPLGNAPGADLPITPYHFGPGLLIKTIGPQHVSLFSFAAANVLIDLESLYHLLRNEYPVHGWAHSFLGAGAIGVIAGLLCALVFRLLRSYPIGRTPLLRGELGVVPVLIGGLLGGITHPLFDSLMHADLQPFWPFSAANPLLRIVTVQTLLDFCVLTGMLGILVLVGRALWKALPDKT